MIIIVDNDRYNRILFV